jgi:hypothetical protein
MGLKTAEVPIRFLKDRGGRVSHHKRMGWLSPWIAGWDNLRAMFVYGASFFLYRPGWLMLIAGLALSVPQSFGPVAIGNITFSLHWMLLGVSLAILGLLSIFLGILMQLLFDYSGARTARWLGRFKYNRAVPLSMAGLIAGVGLGVPVVRQYIALGYRLPEIGWESHLAVLGLLITIASFMSFTFTLVLHATQFAVRRS